MRFLNNVSFKLSLRICVHETPVKRIYNARISHLSMIHDTDPTQSTHQRAVVLVLNPTI